MLCKFKATLFAFPLVWRVALNFHRVLLILSVAIQDNTEAIEKILVNYIHLGIV